MTLQREIQDMVIHPTILPAEGELPRIDVELYWPQVSARYNLSLSDIADAIWTREPHLSDDGVYRRIQNYSTAVIYTDTLLGEDLVEHLLSIQRDEAIHAMVLAMEQPIQECMGINYDALNSELTDLVGFNNPATFLASSHLAAILVHWAWFSQDIVNAQATMESIIDRIELLLIRNPSAYCVHGFINYLRSAFRPHDPHPIRDLSHGQTPHP